VPAVLPVKRKLRVWVVRCPNTNPRVRLFEEKPGRDDVCKQCRVEQYVLENLL
jgi:hypothetical protein